MPRQFPGAQGEATKGMPLVSPLKPFGLSDVFDLFLALPDHLKLLISSLDCEIAMSYFVRGLTGDTTASSWRVVSNPMEVLMLIDA